MRYVWMPRRHERDRARGVKGAALSSLRGRLRAWDRRPRERPDVYVANLISGGRPHRTLLRPRGRGGPPAGGRRRLPDATFERDPGRFLWVHRLVSYKRPLEVAEAFRGLPELKLTMVGVGPLEERLRASLPGNVELLGWIRP